MKKSEIKKSKDNELLVDYIQSVTMLCLNYNLGKATKSYDKHCKDLEEEILKRGILTAEDVKKVNP